MLLQFAHAEHCSNRSVASLCRRNMCCESHRPVLLCTRTTFTSQLHLKVQSHHRRGKKTTVSTRVPQCLPTWRHTAQVSAEKQLYTQEKPYAVTTMCQLKDKNKHSLPHFYLIMQHYGSICCHFILNTSGGAVCCFRLFCLLL